MKSVKQQIRGGAIHNSHTHVYKHENRSKTAQVFDYFSLDPNLLTITSMSMLISLKLSPEARSHPRKLL